MKQAFLRMQTALVLALALGVTLAAAPPADRPADAPADQAMVRFLHAAPNAQVENIVLTGADGDLVLDQFAGLEYGQMSEYVPVALGGYDIGVRLTTTANDQDEVVDVPVASFDTYAGEYYTVALIGLVNPERVEDGGDEGFFGWLSDLFSTDDDAYTLRTVVMSDGITAAIPQNEAELRIAHFAPGVENLELVEVNAEGDVNVLHTVGYGEVSGFARLEPVGTLQVRAAGSEAVMFDLADATVNTGRGHTVILTGTPVEQVPLDALFLDNPEVIGTVGGAAVPPAGATFDADQVAMFREHLIELEARLQAISGRLDNLAGIEGAQEQVAAAQQEVDQAMATLMDARDQVEAQPRIP